MNPLETTLLHKENVFGKDYLNLGKNTGSFFARKKVLLSFDAKKGWKVVSFGLFALFLRNIGFFKSTHLRVISKEWGKTKATTDYKNPLLNRRLKDLWKKNYPLQTFPSYFAVFGNCDPKQAKIKIFGERHNDDEFRKALGYKINKKYQPGDLILTEALAKTKMIKAGEHRQTQFVNPDFDIKGWEPQDFDKLHEDIMGDQLKSFKQLDQSLCKVILSSHVIKQSDITSENLMDFEKTLNPFIQDYTQLATFAFPQNRRKEIVEENLKKIETSFQTVKNDPKNNSGWENFENLLMQIFEEIVKSHETNYVTNLKPQNIQQVWNTFKKRNESLAQEIQLPRMPDSTLFVISGHNHLLKSSIFPKMNAEVDALHKTLNQHLFVIYMKREEFEKRGLEKANKNLNLKIFK